MKRKIYILMIALLATYSGSLWAQTTITAPNGVVVDTTMVAGQGVIVGFVGAGTIQIPATVTDPSNIVFPIDSIAPGAFAGAALTDVTFDGGTTIPSIPTSAFAGSLLRSIVIPPSILGIRDSAFFNCPRLRTVTFDPALTAIDSSAFQGCVALTDLNGLAATGVTRVGSRAFKGCTALPSISLPPSVTGILDSAFYGCTSLATVDFNGNTQAPFSFGLQAFANSGLTSIEIPVGANDGFGFAAGYGTFAGCTKLETVTFAPGNVGVTDIPLGIFTGSSLANITIPVSVATFNLSEVSKTLKTVDFEPGNAITSIPANTFANDSVLVKVTNIPAGVTFIGDSAFMNCVALDSVTFAAGSVLDSIANEVFMGSGLTGWDIPASVTTLGNNVFANCPNLIEVDFSATTLTSVPEGTFKNCTSLANFDFPTTITMVGDSAFLNANQTSLTVPAAVREIGIAAFMNNKLPNIVFEDLSLSTVGIGDSAFLNNPLTRITFEGYALAGGAAVGDKAFGGAPLLRAIVIQEPDPANLPMFPIGNIVAAIDSTVDIVLPPSASVTAAYIADTSWGNDTTVITSGGNTAYIPVTVTFGGSSGVPSRRVPSVAEDSVVTQPADPARSGYAFLGWYNDVDSVITWPFSVNGDTTVYARWREVYVPGEGGSTGPSVPPAPTSTTLKIAGQPTSATIFVGESHTFEVFLSASSGTVTYLWYKDGQPLTGNLSTYTVEDAETSDAGDYYVVITDATGQLISSVATLTVRATQSNESIDGSSFKAYPNPTTGITNVTGLKVGAVLKVYSATGAQVGVYTATAEEITIDLSHLSNGMYFLNVDGKTVRVIKK